MVESMCVQSQCCRWTRELLAVEAMLWTTFTKSRVSTHTTQFNVELLSNLMVDSSTVVPTAGEKVFFLRYVCMYVCYSLILRLFLLRRVRVRVFLAGRAWEWGYICCASLLWDCSLIPRPHPAFHIFFVVSKSGIRNEASETVGRKFCVDVMVLFLDELQPFQSPRDQADWWCDVEPSLLGSSWRRYNETFL